MTPSEPPDHAQSRSDIALVVDIGKPSGAFAWVYAEGGQTADIQRDAQHARPHGSHRPYTCVECLRDRLHDEIQRGRRVELGVEAPLLVPKLGTSGEGHKVDLGWRDFEKQSAIDGSTHRGWYYGAGATTLTMALAELTYLFGGLDAGVTTDLEATSDAGVWVWEAMVSELEGESHPVTQPLLGDGSVARAKDVGAAVLGWEARRKSCEAEFGNWQHAADSGINLVELAVHAAGDSARFVGRSNSLKVYDARTLS